MGLFTRKKKSQETVSGFKLIHDLKVPLVPFGENIMKSDVVMISVDRVASQCAKLKARYIKVKRAIDCILSIMALIILSPIYLIIALAVKIDSPGPVFFKHTRIGKNGKTIKKSVKYYAQLSNRQIAILFGVPFTSDELDYDIGEKLADKDKTTNPDTVKLLKDIEIYKNLKTSYTGFKNKVFMCENTTYNEYNGRINFMNFTEN